MQNLDVPIRLLCVISTTHIIYRMQSAIDKMRNIKEITKKIHFHNTILLLSIICLAIQNPHQNTRSKHSRKNLHIEEIEKNSNHNKVLANYQKNYLVRGCNYLDLNNSFLFLSKCLSESHKDKNKFNLNFNT
jgi:hypothetical protein